MKVLVCGSRTWPSYAIIRARLDRFSRETTTIIHGGAPGADSMAAKAARTLGFKRVIEFPADWEALGRSAGIQRNLVMLDQQPDLVLAFWSGSSPGTQHTISEAKKRGIKVEVW